MTEQSALEMLARGHSLGGVYLSNDEHIRLTAHCSAASVRLAIEGRLIAPDGSVNTIRSELAPTSDRLASTTIANAREGWIVHGHVRAISGAPGIGRCFCRVEVVRGRTGDVIPLVTLAQGFVAEIANLAWPQTRIGAGAAPRGAIRSITGTDPAVNTEWSETVPTNARWRLISARASFVTDATVAARIPGITIDDGAATVYNLPCHTTQAASLTFVYTAAAFGISGFASGTAIAIPIPPDLIMGAGWRVRSSTSVMQAGDNWSAPQLWVEEWIEG